MIKNAIQIIRHNGIGFCLWRTQYALQKKLGLLQRKFPTPKWSRINLADLLKASESNDPKTFIANHFQKGPGFFFEKSALPNLSGIDTSGLLHQADQILQNKFTYFFSKTFRLGQTVDWHLNPATGARAQDQKHWCKIGFFEKSTGDIKFIWELSRFAWAYSLVRAWAATKNEKYAQKFWELFQSWCTANEPNIGANWSCGQECAIRLMAMCFAFYGLAEAKASTPDQMVKLAITIAIHAQRIEKNIGLAISTRTNHSISEAAGIYTAGLLFPEFAESQRWRKSGKTILTTEALKQIYPDGSYIQHSMNYHRLMLQDLIWALRLGELNGDQFDDKLIEQIRKAVDFLYQMQDETGRLPNYGANDGALIVPLNNCDYLDYRPVIGAAYYFFNRKKIYPSGPWDEDLLWLFGNSAAKSKIESIPRQSSAFDTGGYYTIRNLQSWVMTRCHTFKDRPSHADMLHVDLWWKGINILRDSGSFMYYCDEPWQSYFGSTAAHNTIIVNSQSQMQKYGKFMWFDWTKSRLLQYDIASSLKLFVAEHYGYTKNNKNIIHRRNILPLEENAWIIIDDIIGSGSHLIDLYWHLCNVPCHLDKNKCTLSTSQGPVSICVLASDNTVQYQLLKADSQKPAGWESLYYGERSPAPAFLSSDKANLPKRIITVVAFGGLNKAEFNDKWLLISLPTSQEYKLQLNDLDKSKTAVHTIHINAMKIVIG